VLLAGLEAALRVAGFGQPATFLIPSERPGYLRTNPGFVGTFLPGGFDLRPLNYFVPAQKRPGTIRVVVLGESAAQGVPAPQFGFAAQLRAQLRSRYPGRAVEVINTGIVAINSHVVYQIARQMAELSPDAFVVYAGNNEVVGPYGPGCAYLSEMPPLWVVRLSAWVKSTRTGQLANAVAGWLAHRRHPPAEWGGMAMFVNNAVSGDDPRLLQVYANFEDNLRGVVGVASAAGAKTVLCTVASNLSDCAPFLSVHGRGLSEADLSAWTRAYGRGRTEWLLGEADAARGDLAEAERIDPAYAATAFMLGTLALGDGDRSAARRYLCDAEHWDALRFRPDPAINAVVRRVAASGGPGVALVDAAMLLGSDPASTAEPAGRGLFFEHVHPDWNGNYLLSRAVAEGLGASLDATAGDRGPWLGSEACAAALGYTPHERDSVLESAGAIMQNPPFTNQVTYCEDQARLLEALAKAGAARRDPDVLRRAREVVQAAMTRDPANPDLPAIAAGIEDDLGSAASALVYARRAEELQPADFTLATNEAVRLMQMNDTDEAERLLRATAKTATERERFLMAPAFADLFTRTGRLDEGRRNLDQEIARAPANAGLRSVRAEFALRSGDSAGAEREYRETLREDPGNRGALEGLVALLKAGGRADAAGRESLAAADRQPRNYANNLRAAAACRELKDDEREVRYLLAAEASGPMSSRAEGRLARKLLGLGRPDEALAHLALARRVSRYEGDPAATEELGRVIDAVELRMNQTPAAAP
jgi:tetratricopeptide (TPR) repeat protein